MTLIAGRYLADIAAALGLEKHNVARIELVAEPEGLLRAHVDILVTAEQLVALGEVGKKALKDSGQRDREAER